MEDEVKVGDIRELIFSGETTRYEVVSVEKVEGGTIIRSIELEVEK